MEIDWYVKENWGKFSETDYSRFHLKRNCKVLRGNLFFKIKYETNNYTVNTDRC